MPDDVLREWRSLRESRAEGALLTLTLIALIVAGLAAGRLATLFLVPFLAALGFEQVKESRARIVVTREYLIVDNGMRRYAVTLAGVRTCAPTAFGLMISARQPETPTLPAGCRPFSSTARHRGERIASTTAVAVRGAGILGRRHRSATAKKISGEILALAAAARDAHGQPM